MGRKRVNPKSLLNLKLFQKGKSGNPGGRPKKQPISDRYRLMAEIPIADKQLLNALQLPEGATYGDALAISVFRQVIKGNHGAAKEIREAIEGRATLRIEHSGPDGEAIPLTDTNATAATDKLLEVLRGIYGLGSDRHTGKPDPGPAAGPERTDPKS